MSDSEHTAAHTFKRVTLFALGTGLLAAWWGAFHEAVCGFVLAGTGIDPLYAYLGCYAHSAGCILGALLAPCVSSHLSGTSRRKGMFVILGAELVLTVLIFFHLSIHSPIAPTILQIPVNALACIAALLALETLAGFSFRDAGKILVAALCSFAFVNYAVLPALIRLPFGIYGVMTVEIALLAAAGWAVVMFYRLPEELDQQSDAFGLGAGEGHEPIRNRAFAWQPACFLAAYGIAFGLMHVESSRLVVSFDERSVWLLAGIACATIIISLFVLKLNKHKSIWQYYRSVVFPLMICAFLMLQEHEIDLSAISVSLVYASLASFFILTVLACIRISAETAITPVRIGRTAVCLGYGFALVGMSVNNYLTHVYGFAALASPIAAVIVFIVLCAATFWTGDDKSAAKIWGWRIEKDPRSMQDKALDASVSSLSSKYGLTPREKTILTLLAKGKRASQISEEQFISVNTVRTHIRNVYNKLDVHSYQELLEKIDEEDLSGTA